jgi:hypothetical protein
MDAKIEVALRHSPAQEPVSMEPGSQRVLWMGGHTCKAKRQ